MSTGHDPVDDLVLLLSNHSLPEQIDYDLNSTGSTMVSASVVDKISTCLLQSSPQLSRGLQNVLVLYASLLAPTHQPAVGITRASRVDTIESGERYAISTREAQEAALAEMISGELGESHYIMVHLIHPLNLHLRRILLGTGLNVYWRFVGHGPAGKPDIELVYDPSTPRVRRCLIKLAVCEIKSELALPNRLVADIISGVTNRQLKMAGNVVVERGQEHVPRELRAKRCKITEQVSRVPTRGYLGSLSCQALGEMFTRDVNFAVITNYSRSFLLRRTPGQHLGVEHVIELMDTAVNVEYRVDITKLWNSPLGLLLGVTFLAIVDKGIPLGAGAEADEEQGGLQVDARNSSETVRPHLGEMGVMGGAGIGAQGAPGGSGGGSGGAGYSEGMVEVAGSVSQGTASVSSESYTSSPTADSHRQSGNQGVVDGSGDMNGTNDHVPGGSMGHVGENVAQETGNVS